MTTQTTRNDIDHDLRAFEDEVRAELPVLTGNQITETSWAIRRAEICLERHGHRHAAHLKARDLDDAAYYIERGREALVPGWKGYRQ